MSEENINVTKVADTPKIDLSTKKIFVVYDTKTKSLMNAYDNPNKANTYIRKLVKNDLKMIIDDLKLQINITDDEDNNEDENVETNGDRLSSLKNLMYHYDSFESNKNLTFMYGNKMVNRYLIYTLPLNTDINETSYTRIF
jgi:hypothetical protein